MILTSGLLYTLKLHESGRIVEHSYLFSDSLRRLKILRNYGLLEEVDAIQGNFCAHLISPRGKAVLARIRLQVEGCRYINE